VNFSYHDAVALAAAAHGEQVDRAGAPYIFHPLRVARRLDDELDRVVAVLHDVLEDTDVSAHDLLAAGVPQEAVVAVVALSHNPHEPRVDYLARVGANPRAVRVKRADMADNCDPDRLRLLSDAKAAYFVAKYAAAEAVLTQIAGPPPQARTSSPGRLAAHPQR